jgi:formate/nitrite transporter
LLGEPLSEKEVSQPEATYARVAKLADAKISAPFAVQFIQGVLAGATLSLGAMNANLVEASVKASASPTLSNLYGGAVFPVGLIGIFLTGANLFTGNCMYFVPSFLNGTVPRWRSLLFLLVSFASNFIGAAIVTYLLGYQADYFSKDPARAFVIENAEKKCNLGWGVALLRGIGANWLVCLGWWQALSAERDDTIAKIFAVWWPTFTFTAIGFEHSIANMFYVDIGLMAGANASFGQFLWRNLLPVAIGNFIGGAGFVGFTQYLAYDARGLKHDWCARISARCRARRREASDETGFDIVQ